MQLQNEIVKKHTPIKSLLIDWLIIFGTYLFIRIFFALFGLHQNIVLFRNHSRRSAGLREMQHMSYVLHWL